MAEQRERPLNELLSRDMVDIYVGQENTHWILHEKLLCHRSKFFRDVFYKKSEHRNRAFGLPDEDDEPFRLFVGWLYSNALPVPKEERDLGHLFELYLMGEKWAIKGLMVEVLDTVRKFYNETQTYPGLRRVQYIYANTQDESPMRQLLIGSIARDLVLREGLPAHWDKALRKNGQLAVDIILAVQKWKIEDDRVPDPRADSVEQSVDDALNSGAVKQEEVPDDKMPNGVSEVDSEHLTNGVNGVHLDDEEDDE
ncbi:Vacuolar amino acid transporter 5 [Sphaceloma murrayae]|uniref:Vacuolar amino acid transporter 5 n=1 Tax=Sphaceloma murrayae TaxID=2082308 RepID=A0A2K1QHX3_9PEZI|nr:Vacuolar amino acid transporter 5 [Sphaceloma murrayae]